MENHPIPQDVTGFKFRLIGSITVKQFLYILGAGALCGVFFIMPISFLIKWPAIMVIASLGAGLAFLPIEGRPMDVMLINFLKALPAENRYIFRKKGAEALLHDYFIPQQMQKAPAGPTPAQKDSRKQLLLNQLVRKNTSYKVDAEERDQLNAISGIFNDTQTPVTGMSSIDTGSPQEDTKPSVIVRPPTHSSPEPIKADAYTPAPAQEPVAEQPMPAPVETPAIPVPQETVSMPSTPAVSVAPENQIASGFPQIPDTPNVVLGIVKDARGKVLPNIIVEVIDTTGNPVRAFKTNALGQFSSATPLPAGNYQILLEDIRRIHEFSPIDIEMNNEIFQPLEIISTDQREKLRQELFGRNTVQQ